MAARTRTGSPRNQTGLFAAPALTEVKSAEGAAPTPAEHPNRTPRSAKLLLALSEQKRHRDEQSRLSMQDLAKNQDAGGDSQASRNLVRNGFRPSTIRRQRQRVAMTASPRDSDSRDLSPRQAFAPSSGSARLRSEIEHLSSKLRLYDDPTKTSRMAHNRDITGAPFNVLCSPLSQRPVSGSTNTGVSFSRQRSAAATKAALATTAASIPLLDRSSNKSPQTASTVSASSHQTNEDGTRPYVNYHVAHAYQVPQQSTIGSESAFPSTSLSTSIKTRATRLSARSRSEKTIACPFYVMYLTNLTLQQAPAQVEQENAAPPIVLAGTTPRKGTATSRLGTAHSRRTLTRRQAGSPLSMLTGQTIEDDEEYLQNVAPYYSSKRFSAKMVAFEAENSHLVKDVLRTTAWNHVQM